MSGTDGPDFDRMREGRSIAVEAREIRRELEELKVSVDLVFRALHASVKLQSYYADLLNQYDHGHRMMFTTEQWLERLRELEAKGERDEAG